MGNAYVSALDLFSVGIGPSSSHTVGPMRAAREFAVEACAAGTRVSRVTCTLFGSLGSTGIGHGTPGAVVAGLEGYRPETVNPSLVRTAWADRAERGLIRLLEEHDVPFAADDIDFQPRARVHGHPNAMRFVAWTVDLSKPSDANENDRSGASPGEGELAPGSTMRPLIERTYFSIGGGFISREGESHNVSLDVLPFPYGSADELLGLCSAHDLRIADLALVNERALQAGRAIEPELDRIWAAMRDCIRTGLEADGTLPGFLSVRRRAPSMRRQLDRERSRGTRQLPEEWLSAFALAVNEENASGGRVVTAPTNGAAGVVPAVAAYWWCFLAGQGVTNEHSAEVEVVDITARLTLREGANRDLVDERRDGIRKYLLTATALGSLFKANASISGAAGGCQAEVGSACAMAAGGLTAVLGGTNAQVETAAEIAMEHHLGLTCDPVGGLVQIPCIERNAVAASTAVTAARLALRGDGSHYVSLDVVIETMRQTGEDMSTKYKETSEGGLAVNVVEC